MKKTLIVETWLALTVLLPQQFLQQVCLQEVSEWHSCDNPKGTNNASFV